jgi:hypothetical protein
MPPRRPRRARSVFSARPTVVLLTGALLIASGCGGGTRQDAHEVKRSYRLDVVHASFPAIQSIARPTRLILAVHNSGVRTAPNVAVTIDSFEYTENFPELSADKRPIWVVDAGPGDTRHPAYTASVSPAGGGQTATTNTWALGPLAPGATRIFRWLLAPVKAGRRTVKYTVAAGLGGNARAVSASGGPVGGVFGVYVSASPPPSQVNPNTGEVVPGIYPAPPGAPRHPLRAKVGASRSSG